MTLLRECYRCKEEKNRNDMYPIGRVGEFLCDKCFIEIDGEKKIIEDFMAFIAEEDNAVFDVAKDMVRYILKC